MVQVLRLPLARDELPESIQRFGDPAAPDQARLMAAKGLVPVKGEALVSLLVQLSGDSNQEVAQAARGTIGSLPEVVLQAACAAALHPAILDGLMSEVRSRSDLLQLLAGNRATADATMERIARFADERTCERIATDQQRLLGAPEIIEALYKNKSTRMSTVDRLVELAARNKVELRGVATFQAHVEAIQDQLIPEADDEPLPDDVLFQEAVEHDDSDIEAIELDEEDGEEIKDQHKPLAFRIGGMKVQDKLRMTLIGDAAARAVLVRDSNKVVAMAAIGSPKVSDSEASRIAASRQVSEDILRYIGNKRDWLSNYEVKRNLIFNSKTPMGVSMKFLAHLRLNDLKALSHSRNVPGPLKTAAGQRLKQKKRS